MQIILNDTGSGELYLKIMKAICGDTSDKSLLDIMCHHAPYTSQLGFRERTYVDIQDRPLDDNREQKYFVQDDAMKFIEQGKQYDVINCSDGIEHLSKEVGYKMIQLMMLHSKKQIIFTPLGEYKLTIEEHPDSHKSGWTPEYFKGWAAISLPSFHPLLNFGAFFAWHCDDIEQDFQRVKQELL